MKKSRIVLICFLVLCVSCGKVKLNSSIAVIENNGGQYYIKHLSNLSVYKDVDKGHLYIDIEVERGGWNNLRFLVRLFDKNGNYLAISGFRNGWMGAKCRPGKGFMKDLSEPERGWNLFGDVHVADGEENEVGKGFQRAKAAGAILDHSDEAIDAFTSGIG